MLIKACLNGGFATWHVIRAALRLGRDIRVGLEDTAALPDGSTTAGNAERVATAVRLAAEAGHGP
jgi:3-keto-5-aminohexanoate cleavage enzyme